MPEISIFKEKFSCENEMLSEDIVIDNDFKISGKKMMEPLLKLYVAGTESEKIIDRMITLCRVMIILTSFKVLKIGKGYN